MDSNLERLPWLARQLKAHTPKIKPIPARDEELFAFAVDKGWKDRLDSGVLTAVSDLLRNYEAVLARVRASRVPPRERPRKTDIDRILYARGQEEIFDSDELYALFRQLEPERIAALRRSIRERSWHLMDRDERERFLWNAIPELADSFDLLTDFRAGGCRILGDLVCDIDEENTALERRQLTRDGDSEAVLAMLNAYREKPFTENYRETVAGKCRGLLDRVAKPSLAVRHVVALGRRDLLWDLLIDQIEKNAKRGEARPYDG